MLSTDVERSFCGRTNSISLGGSSMGRFRIFPVRRILCPPINVNSRAMAPVHWRIASRPFRMLCGLCFRSARVVPWAETEDVRTALGAALAGAIYNERKLEIGASFTGIARLSRAVSRSVGLPESRALERFDRAGACRRHTKASCVCTHGIKHTMADSHLLQKRTGERRGDDKARRKPEHTEAAARRITEPSRWRYRARLRRASSTPHARPFSPSLSLAPTRLEQERSQDTIARFVRRGTGQRRHGKHKYASDVHDGAAILVHNNHQAGQLGRGPDPAKPQITGARRRVCSATDPYTRAQAQSGDCAWYAAGGKDAPGDAMPRAS